MTEFNIIVYGASGFTGRLVAEYLARQQDPNLRLALGGRSQSKLESVRKEIGAGHVPLVLADSDDIEDLRRLCRRTQVVVSTVGPYQLHGSRLIAACAETGTAYVDLCGEPGWMRQMIDLHHEQANASGARIVFSCGFDSVPFDLGVLTLQGAAIERFGAPVSRVKARVQRLRGGISGGTLASLQATLDATASDARLREVLAGPFALTPGYEGRPQPDGSRPHVDEDLGAWVAPFFMATINTKNVHRTNFLLGNPWPDLVYDEMSVTGAGEVGKKMAENMARVDVFKINASIKPGDGPTKEERDAGLFEILFIGRSEAGAQIKVVVTGDTDPGYACTAKMVGEAALCLAEDAKGSGGIWTPGALLGSALRNRLVAHAGMTFEVL